jgi:hypothetical protein
VRGTRLLGCRLLHCGVAAGALARTGFLSPARRNLAPQVGKGVLRRDVSGAHWKLVDRSAMPGRDLQGRTAVITEALGGGDIYVNDARMTARSVITQLEGQVLFARVYNNTQRLETLWGNCLSLLGAHRGAAELSSQG